MCDDAFGDALAAACEYTLYALQTLMQNSSESRAQRPFVSIPTNLRIASDDLAKAGLNGLSVFPVLSHF